ncbi:unnamed protein product [Blepharisma stoltei]|uniref:Uncharacterized protein n=1 Tax=Blepharisma stoltei TaxID=1481888 RepID=A0AAU9ILJ9_9CILI|nr:unnamed protein product [Blepharisma stoltei]
MVFTQKKGIFLMVYSLTELFFFVYFALSLLFTYFFGLFLTNYFCTFFGPIALEMIHIGYFELIFNQC